MTASSAVLHGTVNPNSLSSDIRFEYGLTDAYGDSVPGTPASVNGNSTIPVTADLNDLLAGTTYHFRIKATNAAGTSWGNDLTFTTLPQYTSISGVVTYDNEVNTPLDSTTVNLYLGNDLVQSTLTSADGSYTFNVTQPGTYFIQASSVKPWGGVNAADPLIILKHFVQSDTLYGLRYQASDVDDSGYTNAIDALLSAQRFVGIISGFAAGDWVFTTDALVVSGSQNYTADIRGICYGDVNGSYIPDTKSQ